MNIRNTKQKYTILGHKVMLRGLRFQNTHTCTFLQNNGVDCFIPEISLVFSFYKNQCLLLFPGLALRSREHLAFCVPCPRMSQDLTARAGTGSVEDSFCLLLQSNFASSSLLPLPIPMPAPHWMGLLPLSRLQEATRIACFFLCIHCSCC